jgi:large subunit ribosomal protein L9
MKVLLIKDVYKLGHAGDVKKVATGYGRNYLIPQGLAVIATAGALKQADRIRKDAAVQRAALNEEMGGFAEQLAGKTLTFPARASETGKLYGSVTTRMIAETLVEETGVEISHRQVDTQPLRMLGEHHVGVRLTVDLVPEVRVIVYREGESPEAALAEVAALAEAAEEAAAAEEAEAAEEAAVAEAAITADDTAIAEETAVLEEDAGAEAAVAEAAITEEAPGEGAAAVEELVAEEEEPAAEAELLLEPAAEDEPQPETQDELSEAPEPAQDAELSGEESQAPIAEDELEPGELDDKPETD